MIFSTRSLFAGRSPASACIAIGSLCIAIGSLGAARFARADNQMPGPQLTSVFPAGGKQATSVEVSIAGANIDDATSLVFSHPGLSATAKMVASKADDTLRPEPRQFTVTISGTVPPGLYEVRAAGPSGISNPRTFAVGTLNEVVDRDPADKISTAREVPLESTISAVMGGERADFFKFTAKRGQRVLIESWARRIDSKLDPRLVLYDAAGHELARAKERIHRDALLDFTAPADGSYVVKLYDFLYQGGQDYFYRLTLSTGPRLDFIMPPSGLAGSKSKYTLFGRNLPGGVPTGDPSASGTPLERLDVEIQLPTDPAAIQQYGGDAFAEATQFDQDAFAYRLQTPRGETNPINIYYAAAPVVREQEPNNTPAQAQKISLPCEVVGQFNPRGDQDWYQFDARQGDAWTIEVFSQRMGLSTDPYLLVQRVNHAADGKEQMADVAESDDTKLDRRHEERDAFLNLEFDDPVVHFVAPQDGTYRVLVRDLYGESRGSPEYIYRLAIHRPAPNFRALLLEEAPSESDNHERVNLWSAIVHAGRSTSVAVLAKREDGFAGPIHLSVEGLPPEITCPGATIGPGADIASLVFTAAGADPAKTKAASAVKPAAPNPAAWNGALRVVARAKIGDRDVIHEARVVTSVWRVEQASQQPVAFRMAPQFALAASANSMPRITLDLGDGKPLQTAPGAKLELPVKIARGDNRKGIIKCWISGACPGMSYSELDIPPDATQAKLPLMVTSQVPPGEYTLPLRAYAYVNCRNNPEAADAATARAKSLDKLAATLSTAARKADDARRAAETSAANADTSVRQALESLAAAERTLHQAADRAKSAAEALTPLEKTSTEAAAKLKAAETAQADTKPNPANATAENSTANGNSDAAEALRKARDASRQADAARDAARAAARAADTQRNSAEAAKAAIEKKLADATALAKSADSTRTAAAAAATEAQAKSHAADAEKSSAADRARQASDFAQPRDYSLVFYSNPLALEVRSAPLALTIAAPKPARPGEKIEVPLELARQFGFADAVYAGLAPGSESSLHAGDITIPSGESKAKLVVQLDPQIKPGEHRVNIRARMTFNGQGSELVEPLLIDVQPVPPKPAAPKPAAPKTDAAKTDAAKSSAPKSTAQKSDDKKTDASKPVQQKAPQKKNSEKK